MRAVTTRAAAALRTLLTGSPLAAGAFRLGPANRRQLEVTGEAMGRWGEDPATFGAEAWREAVVWRR